MSAPSAKPAMSNVYVPGAVVAGTLMVTVNSSSSGGVTGPTAVGLNETHEPAAGAGVAEATSRCTLLTVTKAELIRATIWDCSS